MGAALVKSFFDFFAREFDFSREVASVRLGHWCLRAQGSSALRTDPQVTDCRLALEDPVETNWDLGQILSSERAAHVQAEFRRASALLEQSSAGDVHARVAAVLRSC